MNDKSSKTVVTIVVGVLLLVAVIFILRHLWPIVLGGFIGLCFGYYFGYTKGKERGKRS